MTIEARKWVTATRWSILNVAWLPYFLAWISPESSRWGAAVIAGVLLAVLGFLALLGPALGEEPGASIFHLGAAVSSGVFLLLPYVSAGVFLALLGTGTAFVVCAGAFERRRVLTLHGRTA